MHQYTQLGTIMEWCETILKSSKKMKSMYTYGKGCISIQIYTTVWKGKTKIVCTSVHNYKIILKKYIKLSHKWTLRYTKKLLNKNTYMKINYIILKEISTSQIIYKNKKSPTKFIEVHTTTKKA